MKGKDFFILGGTAVITLSLIHFDEEIDDFFKPIKNDNEFVEDVSPQVTELGDYYGYLLLAGYGCYTIGFHKYKGFRTALLASQAAVSAGLWIRVFKTLSGRMRPSVTYTDPEYHSDHWFGPFAQFDDEVSQNRSIAAFDAFPSGHTGAAFAMATVFAEQYKEYKAVPIIFYSAASIVGVTRMIEHEHWASDVFLGGVIGYFCGKQIIANEHRLFPEYKMAVKKSYSYFTPFSSAGFYGIEWRMVF